MLGFCFNTKRNTIIFICVSFRCMPTRIFPDLSCWQPSSWFPKINMRPSHHLVGSTRVFQHAPGCVPPVASSIAKVANPGCLLAIEPRLANAEVCISFKGHLSDAAPVSDDRLEAAWRTSPHQTWHAIFLDLSGECSAPSTITFAQQLQAIPRNCMGA